MSFCLETQNVKISTTQNVKKAGAFWTSSFAIIDGPVTFCYMTWNMIFFFLIDIDTTYFSIQNQF